MHMDIIFFFQEYCGKQVVEQKFNRIENIFCVLIKVIYFNMGR